MISLYYKLGEEEKRNNESMEYQINNSSEVDNC